MDSYLYEDAFERNLSKEIREYSKDEVPIDIGTWVSYMPYHSIEQKQLQFEHLLSLPIENSYGPVKFILTKNIETYEKYLEQISKKIRIENTTTVLEKEVFYTSKIEGAKTTRKRTQELHNGSPIKEDNAFSEAMIVGNFRAVKMLNLYGNRFDKDILYKVWKTLTENCRQNEDIQGDRYRIGDVGITNSDFIAVSPKELEPAMDRFLQFYESSLLNDRPFLKACIIHYAFETIHPFCDGNGRLGRLLMNNYLIGRGIESCRAVSFSEQIDKNRGLYDGAFISSENEYGDCTPFVMYMMEKMADAYFTAMKTQNE